MAKPFNTEASSSQKPGHHTKAKRPRHEAQDTPSTAKTPLRPSSPDQLNLVPYIMAKPFKAKVSPPIQATVSKCARKTPSKPEASSSRNPETSPYSTSSELYEGRRSDVNVLTNPFKPNVDPFKTSHHASEPQASTSGIGRHNVTAKRPRHEDETPLHHSSSESDQLYRRPPRKTPRAEMVHRAYTMAKQPRAKLHPFGPRRASNLQTGYHATSSEPDPELYRRASPKVKFTVKSPETNVHPVQMSQRTWEPQASTSQLSRHDAKSKRTHHVAHDTSSSAEILPQSREKPDLSDEVLPATLRDFSSMGRPCTSSWMQEVWQKVWVEGQSGMTIHAVVRDSDPLNNPKIPSNCWVMERLHPEEFNALQISGAYIRHSYHEIAQFMIASYQGHANDTVAMTAEEEVQGAQVITGGTVNFSNPFAGFKTQEQKVILICGSPNNGKSVFLRFLLRCRLLAKLPTIVQLDGEVFTLFTEFGVRSFHRSPFRSVDACRLSSIQPDLWCLVDSTETNPIPLQFLISSRLSLIQTASPRMGRAGWADNRVKRKYYMPPFTLEEVIIARSMQCSPPRESELQHWFDLYVPSAGLAYLYAGDHANYEEDKLRPSLNTIKEPASLKELAEDASALKEDAISCHIFVFHPFNDYPRSECHIPTLYLTSKVVERCQLLDDESRSKCFRIFLPIPRLASAAGHIMELLAHNSLLSGGTWPLLNLSATNHDVNQHWIAMDDLPKAWLVIGETDHPLRIPLIRPSDFRPPDDFELTVRTYETCDSLQGSELIDNCFYVPQSPVQATFDSFYHCDGHVCIFQCTITNTQHTVNEKGLEMMKNLGVKSIAYIGVVPLGRKPKFIIKLDTVKDYGELITAKYLL